MNKNKLQFNRHIRKGTVYRCVCVKIGGYPCINDIYTFKVYQSSRLQRVR